MSLKKRKLSVDQIEVHRACFGDSDSDSHKSSEAPAVTVSNASQGVIEKNLFMCSDGSTLDLTNVIQSAVDKQVAIKMSELSRPSEDPASSFAGNIGSQEPNGKGTIRDVTGHHPPVDHSIFSVTEESDSEQESGSDDMEELIGANVNSKAHRVRNSENAPLKTVHFEDFVPCDLSSPNRATSGVTEPSVPGSFSTPDAQSNTEPPVVGVDPDLPGCRKRTANFNPDALVVDWARGHFKDIPKAKEFIKQLEEDYIPVPSCQDIFSPIKSSDFILKAMQDKQNISADTIYFDRLKCERLLFKSQHLLGLAYCPFMDALTKLKDIPGANVARKLIGTGILAMSSARHEISFVRRELCRKLIRSDVYPHLYSNPPTFTELFGGDSIEDQVSKAKQAAKSNLDFIYKKPKPKYNSSKSANSGGFLRQGKAQGSQVQEKSSNKSKGFQKRRKGKGRGQSKSPAAKDDTTN